jgi:hypothetical protein
MSDQVTIIDDAGITSTDDARFACEVCGTPLNYGGRGRYPRFCDEHKSGSKSSDGTPRKASRGTAQITQSVQQLYEMAGQGLTLIGGFTGDEALKLDGVIIDDRAPILAGEWAKLAETDPKVREALKKLTTGSAYGGVIVTHLLLVFALAQNHRNNPKPPRERKPKPPKPEPQPPMRPAATEPQRNGNRRVTVPDMEFESPINIPDELYVTESK